MNRPLSGIRLLIATDAWEPQVNGVVKTLQKTIELLRQGGAEVSLIEPTQFRSFPCPGYPQIPLALPPPRRIAEKTTRFDPTHIHIATEGPIGWMMRRHCLRNGLAFSSAYHTRFPEYTRERFPVPLAWTYALMRRFHNAGKCTLVTTASMQADLARRGFRHLRPWSRGVDLTLFSEAAKTTAFDDLKRPILLSVGRIAPEKNLSAFLAADCPGTKVVIGDGPDREKLSRRFPTAVFLGARSHRELAPYYAAADVFVFPSRTDTFGLVMVEAMACGLPVAAYPVPGPIDVIGQSGAGALHEDIGQAICTALSIDRSICRRHAMTFRWEAATEQFVDGLVPVRASAPMSCGSFVGLKRPQERRLPVAP
jgi:glycosyltransferase involved in cell wall biosynthesis